MSLTVSPAQPHELSAALRLIFGDAAPGDHDPHGLFVARDSDSVCGAVLAQPLPGALGVACPPRAVSDVAEDWLMRAACDWLRSRGVKVCQAFATAAERPGMAPLERNGFRHVTQLVSMRRDVEQTRGRPQPGDLLGGVSPRPDTWPRFAAAILATLDGSLDCPELNGRRTTEELLAAFTPPAGGASWHFHADDSGEIVGLSLLEYGEADVQTIGYLGVVPSARGRGLGGKLLRHILTEATCYNGLRVSAVEVSVDARNEPALRLYRRHGFAETDRREVFIAHLPSEPGA